MGDERRGTGWRWMMTAAVVVAAVLIDGIALLGVPQHVSRLVGAEPTTAASASSDPAAEAATEVRRVQDALLAQDPECFGAAAFARDACRDAESAMAAPDPATARAEFESFPGCYSRPHESRLKVCDLGATEGAPRVLVLGDSHARVLLGAFRRLADQGALSVSAAVKSSCAWTALPLPEGNDPERSLRCRQWRENLTGWLQQHAADFDLIVTNGYVRRMVGSRQEKVDGLVEAWAPATDAGVPIVAVRDNPRWPTDPHECLAATGAEAADECILPREEALQTFDPAEQATERVAGSQFLDLADYYCGDVTCPAVIGGVGVYRNDNHVSAAYAATLAPWILGELAERDLLG